MKKLLIYFICLFFSACTFKKRIKFDPKPKVIEDVKDFFSKKYNCGDGIQYENGSISYKDQLEANINEMNKIPNKTERSIQWLHYQLSILDCDIPKSAKKTILKSFLTRKNYNKDHNNYHDLLWHDHVTALRLVRLFNSYNNYETELNKSIVQEIKVHLNILSKHNFYSRLTNHGYDQSFISYLVSYSLGSNQYQNLFRERLQEEIDFMFTDEGVHKENSPAYHQTILNSLEKLYLLLEKISKNVRIDSKLIEKAKKFSKSIIKHDKTYPLIGDTTLKKYSLGEVKSNIENVQPHDYSNSGFVIIKSKSLYFTFKNSYLSNYHRHDDDLSITMSYDNEDFLIDSGLYKYDERDEKRIYIRSYRAHSLPYNSNAKASRAVKNGLSSTMLLSEDDEHYKVTAESKMFEPLKIKRKIIFNKNNDKIITIKDSFSRRDSNRIRFIVPEGVSIAEDSKLVTLSGKTLKVKLGFTPVPKSIVLGESPYSEKYNEIKNGSFIDIEWPERQKMFEYETNIEIQ